MHLSLITGVRYNNTGVQPVTHLLLYCPNPIPSTYKTFCKWVQFAIHFVDVLVD